MSLKTLIPAYSRQFKNLQIIVGGLLMGACVSFVYVFFTLAPFLAEETFGIKSSTYGISNSLASLGLIAGSIAGGQWAEKYRPRSLTRLGIMIIFLGIIIMFLATVLKWSSGLTLFLPMGFINFGSCLVLANASALGMSHATDKAHGSAVMNFINVGMTTLVVLLLGIFPISLILLPVSFLILGIFISLIFTGLRQLKIPQVKER